MSAHTPASAVLLALRDFHKAHGSADANFQDALREAERQLTDPVRAAAPDMAAALLVIAKSPIGSMDRHSINVLARAALAKARVL